MSLVTYIFQIENQLDNLIVLYNNNLFVGIDEKYNRNIHFIYIFKQIYKYINISNNIFINIYKVNNYFKLINVIYFRKISENISILFQLLFYPVFIIKNHK